MNIIERLARDLCIGLMLDPDGQVADPRTSGDLFTWMRSLTDTKKPTIARWQLFTKATHDMLVTLRNNPSQSMIEKGNIGLGKVRSLPDPQAQVAWRHMFDELIESAEFTHIPTTQEIIPVLQDWVGTISRRQQGVLILALRGPDGFPKEHGVKNAVRSMRACVMNSGREGKPMELGQRYETDSFMRMDLVSVGQKWRDECAIPFFASLDQYNIHFYTHFLHAAAVLGFNHPIEMVRIRWKQFYEHGCSVIHMTPETEEQFTHRLRDGIREGE